MGGPTGAPAPQRRQDAEPVREGRAATISAYAAAGGLIIAAASMVFTGCQTQLAREQATEAAEDQKKRQARLVNIWPEREFGLDRLSVMVSNRSREPIYNFRIYFTLGRKNTEPVAVRGWYSFPPCMQAIFDLGAIARSYPETAGRLRGPTLPRFDYGLTFVDVSGQAWHSRPGTSISSVAWLEPLHDGTRDPKLPNYLRENKPPLLEGPSLTVPGRAQPYVLAAPSTAAGCQAGAP
ncbi:hypothetical protein D0T12_21145 [Actinomadura spongiicola]|uniref:Uncharacterized protein n=1 Tax=Actinomadura spongiicola TaxID=2303421 RepID=A0A372GDU9_9ACTN|nr:hypothetical protein [Actinomadura spongiicola]RFS83544.1 hypothetical protein D0T12_21145 [Actinomadura spongiicola]